MQKVGKQSLDIFIKICIDVNVYDKNAIQLEVFLHPSLLMCKYMHPGFFSHMELSWVLYYSTGLECLCFTNCTKLAKRRYQAETELRDEVGSCSSNWTPSLGTSICPKCSPKKKNQKPNKQKGKDLDIWRN